MTTTMTFNERVNIKMLHYLLDLEFNDFVDICEYKNNNNQEHQRDFRLFKAHLMEMVQGKGGITRTYRFEASKSYGRRYSAGLQGMKKVYRGALCKGISTDIDLVNCHPTILEYICITHNIDCPFLTAYNANREKYLEKMILKEKVSREEAKEAFLIATNTEYQQRKYQLPFYTSYDNEMKDIQQELMKIDEFKQMKEDAKSVNTGGSFINLVMCKYENEILEEIMNCVKSRNLEIQTLMFDGLTIYGDHYQDETLLTAINNHLSTTWNFTFVVAYKEHMDKVKITSSVKEELSYEDLKIKFEKNHIKVGKFYLKELDEGIVCVLTRGELLDMYEHLNCYGKKGKKKSFIKLWCTDGDIRRLDKMDIYPNNSICPKDTYNLWTPFAAEQIAPYEEKPEALELFLTQLDYLCNHETQVVEFVKIWVAHMIQHPENKSVMLVFFGEEGNAKTWFVLILEAMLGSTKVFVTSEPSRDVWGHFNPLMKDAFLVNLNEISRQEFNGSGGKVKQLITEPKFTWHDKGKTPVVMKSYHRLLATTNMEDCMPTKKGSRRDALIETSSEMIIRPTDSEEESDRKGLYFKMLYNMLQDEDAVATIYNYFKNLPNIPKVINKSMMPVTAYQQRVQKLNRDTIEIFMENWAYNNEKDDKPSVAYLWDSFKSFCVENGFKFDFLTSDKFASRLTCKKLPGVSQSQVEKRLGQCVRYRVIEIKPLKAHFNIVEECLLKKTEETAVEREKEEDEREKEEDEDEDEDDFEDYDYCDYPRGKKEISTWTPDKDEDEELLVKYENRFYWLDSDYKLYSTKRKLVGLFDTRTKQLLFLEK